MTAGDGEADGGDRDAEGDAVGGPGPDPFAEVRARHMASGLARADLAPTPAEQYGRWLEEARAAGVDQADAAVASTAGADGRVTARHVLIRGVDEAGFRFYTNYDSEKGRQLAANPSIALTVPWAMIGRQVRIEGEAEVVDASDSDRYWATRPRGSRIAARASRQSEPTPDRADLQGRVADEERRWEGTEVPRPSHWGGYLVRPRSIEFWQAGASRLHDRLVYTRAPDGTGWAVARLDP